MRAPNQRFGKGLWIDVVPLLDEYETKKKNGQQTQELTELVLGPLNKALEEENWRLKTEIEVLKERELSKNREILLKQDRVDEYKARSKSMEEENQRLKVEVSSLKGKIAFGAE